MVDERLMYSTNKNLNLYAKEQLQYYKNMFDNGLIDEDEFNEVDDIFKRMIELTEEYNIYHEYRSTKKSPKKVF